ncbi:MAG: hypothetical protein AAF367_02900 [Pseudomonadota bacterium]
MEMIVHSVSTLSSDWRAWIVAALVAAKAMHSLYISLRCPVMRGTATVTDEMIAEGREFKLKPPLSFLLIMLAGIGLAIGGLYMLNSATYGPRALGVMVIGIFIFTTEPMRLVVNAMKMEVFGAVGKAGDAEFLARDQLRSAYRGRAVVELVIAAAVLTMLYFL